MTWPGRPGSSPRETRVKIEWDDRMWTVDVNELSLTQAVVIAARAGRRSARRGGTGDSGGGGWLTRFTSERDLAGLRIRYMFDLAAVCHCPPPVADVMRFTDWAVMAAGLDKIRAEAQKAGG